MILEPDPLDRRAWQRHGDTLHDEIDRLKAEVYHLRRQLELAEEREGWAIAAWEELERELKSLRRAPVVPFRPRVIVGGRGPDGPLKAT